MKQTNIGTATNIGLLILMGMSAAEAFGQNQQKKEEPKNPFSLISGQVVKVKFNGVDLIYSKKTLVAKDGKEPKIFQEPITETFTVMVPFVEKVDGIKVTKMRPETRTRTIMRTKVIGGEYKLVPTELGTKARYFSLDGKKIERDQVVKQIGMKEAYLLVLGSSQPIMPVWKSILKDNVFVVRSDELLKASFESR